MHGYVRPPLGELPPAEADRFRRAYCGLCHALSRRYGLTERFILNYDFTYLAILLSDREEAEPERARCPASPLRRRDHQPATEALALAADESVILAYWQARDGVADHGTVGGWKYRAGCGALRGAYQKAAARRPGFDRAVRRQLDILAGLEAQRCAALDPPADAFAALLAGAAAEVADRTRRRVLEQILYHLGRWVYLVDAADDLKEDAASGNFNPVALRYGLRGGVWTPEARADFTATLDHSIRMMTTAYELWDFGVWSPLLEATFYGSLFTVGRAVLDGNFRAVVRGRYKEKHKNVEEST